MSTVQPNAAQLEATLMASLLLRDRRLGPPYHGPMKHILTIALTALTLPFAGAALADIPPPNTQGCANRKASDACKNDNGNDGTCTASKCSKLDYSKGTPPSTVEYDCLVCTSSGGGTSGGCSMSAGTGASGALFAALALPLLLRRRRRMSR